MTNICASRKSKLLTALNKELKPLGYTRQSATFQRQASPEFIRVIHIEMSRKAVPGNCECLMHIGVYLPILHQGSVPSPLKWYHCDFRLSLGWLLNDPDKTWRLEDNVTTASQALIAALRQHGQPWLERYSSYASIVANRSVQDNNGLTIAEMLVELGDPVTAQIVYQEVYDYNVKGAPVWSKTLRDQAARQGILLREHRPTIESRFTLC